MIPGLRYTEPLRGTFHRLDEPTRDRAIALTASVRTADVHRLGRDERWELTGEIQVEGLAERAPIQGTLTFKLFDERRVAYRFRFPGDNGRTYEFFGQKEWSPIAPVGSLTELPASIYDERGEEIGRAVLRFDWRSDWRRFVRSFGLARRRRPPSGL